jgi:hypothetical protein
VWLQEPSNAGNTHTGQLHSANGGGACAGALARVASKWEEDYVCSATNCQMAFTLEETSAAGGSHAGEKHTACNPGFLRWKGTYTRKDPHVIRTKTFTLEERNEVRTLPGQTEETGYESFPVPAVGVALGATWVFASGDPQTWAHEVGHHRHLEHTPDLLAGADNTRSKKEHDSRDNTHVAWNAHVAANVRNWSRRCIMSYYSPGNLTYFCGKCVLRSRGWKVATLTLPAAGVTD